MISYNKIRHTSSQVHSTHTHNIIFLQVSRVSYRHTCKCTHTYYCMLPMVHKKCIILLVCIYLLEPCFQRLFNKLYSFCFIIYNFTFGTLIKVKCCKSEGKEVSGGSSTEHPIPIKIGTVCAATSCQSPVSMQQENFLAALNASTIKYQSSMKQKVASPE